MTRRPLAFLCLLCIALIAALTVFGIPPERGYREKDTVCRLLEVPRSVSVTGEVLRSEVQEDYSYFILRQAVLSVDSQHYKISNVKVTLKVPVRYAAGVRVSAFGVLRVIESPTNPGQFDKAFYYRLQGVGYTMSSPDLTVTSSRVNPFRKIPALIRDKMKKRIRMSYPEDIAGLISAMIIGDKTLLLEEVRSVFAMGGVSHMLAISGLHISLFGEGLYHLLALIPVLRKDRKRGAGFVSIVLLVLYAIFTGLSVATVRAAIMFVIMRGAAFCGRTYDPPTAIAMAALLILIEQPLYIFYNGFILSFAAVSVITFFRERSSLVLGLFLFLSTLPVIIRSYYEFSTYTVLINLIVVPLMPFILLFGLLGTVFGGGLGGIPSLPAIFLLRTIMKILDFFRKLPYANFVTGRPDMCRIILYYVLLVIFLYFSDRSRTKKIRFLLYPFVVPMIAVLMIRMRSGLSLHFLDIGQGDCCVMEMPGGQNIMVDGGSSTVYDVGKERIMPFLKYEGIGRLDYIFVTHMDSDHISGVAEILEAIRDGETVIKAEKIVLPYLKEHGEAYREMENLSREAGVDILYVKSGDRFSFEGNDSGSGHPDRSVTFTILGPAPEAETSPVDENGQCITFALKYGDFDCLMTGDVQNEGEANMTRLLREAHYTAEVLKVAHHGSKYSTPEEFLKIVDPAISIISCGRDNWYGHPHAALLRRLMKIDTEILRTDEGGEVTVRTDGTEYSWETYLSPHGSFID